MDQMRASNELRNCYGANVLHISSQGDQPASLFYFITEKNMDINEIDHRGSTPLHWACYSRSEFALSFLLALKPDLEIQDKMGFTPLHLAIRAADELKSTRAVRSLLLKGAKRSPKTLEGQSCTDLINKSLPVNMKEELQQILVEPSYVECCMVKTPMVKLRKNHKT